MLRLHKNSLDKYRVINLTSEHLSTCQSACIQLARLLPDKSNGGSLPQFTTCYITN